jgi:hypothetical protein
MNKKLSSLEIKRLIQQYALLKTEEEYKNELITENKPIFLEKVSELKKEMFPEKEKINEEQKEEKKEETKQEENKEKGKTEENNEENKEEESDVLTKKDDDHLSASTKSKIKRMYRDIVKITHPDRDTSNKYLDLHIKATNAFEENNLFELCEICNELGINFEIDSEDIEALSKIVQEKNNKNRIMEGSFIWLWINAKDEKDKENIVKLFIKQTSI